VQEREARETTDLRNGATEPTEGTDPASPDSEFDAAPAGTAGWRKGGIPRNTQAPWLNACLCVPRDPALPRARSAPASNWKAAREADPFPPLAPLLR
jgi:hypothetical protein